MTIFVTANPCDEPIKASIGSPFLSPAYRFSRAALSCFKPIQASIGSPFLSPAYRFSRATLSCFKPIQARLARLFCLRHTGLAGQLSLASNQYRRGWLAFYFQRAMAHRTSTTPDDEKSGPVRRRLLVRHTCPVTDKRADTPSDRAAPSPDHRAWKLAVSGGSSPDRCPSRYQKIPALAHHHC